MLTSAQIRSARAMLDWDMATLAAKSRLNRGTIHNLEKGLSIARGDTLAALMETFEKEGLEFIGDRGIARKHENYRIIEGSDCYLRLLDEIYHELRKKPDTEVLSICTDDSVSPAEVVSAIKRWHEAGIKCRFLSHENATRFDFPLDEYRLISSKFFKNSVTVVYGDKVATLRVSVPEEDEKNKSEAKSKKPKPVSMSVLVIIDQDQADMLRGLFELIWEKASTPPPGMNPQSDKPHPKAKK